MKHQVITAQIQMKFFVHGERKHAMNVNLPILTYKIYHQDTCYERYKNELLYFKFRLNFPTAT